MDIRPPLRSLPPALPFQIMKPEVCWIRFWYTVVKEKYTIEHFFIKSYIHCIRQTGKDTADLVNIKATVAAILRHLTMAIYCTKFVVQHWKCSKKRKRHKKLIGKQSLKSAQVSSVGH